MVLRTLGRLQEGESTFRGFLTLNLGLSDFSGVARYVLLEMPHNQDVRCNLC